MQMVKQFNNNKCQLRFCRSVHLVTRLLRIVSEVEYTCFTCVYSFLVPTSLGFVKEHYAVFTKPMLIYWPALSHSKYIVYHSSSICIHTNIHTGLHVYIHICMRIIKRESKLLTLSTA